MSNDLSRVAKEGKFWSYIAGTIKEVYKKYGVLGGMCLEVTQCSLPVKKGLSLVCAPTMRSRGESFRQVLRD